MSSRAAGREAATKPWRGGEERRRLAGHLRATKVVSSGAGQWWLWAWFLMGRMLTEDIVCNAWRRDRSENGC